MPTELTDPDDDGILEFTQTAEDVDGDSLSITLELDEINGTTQSGSDRDPSWLSFTTSSSLSGGTRRVDVDVEINASELGGAGTTYTFELSADDGAATSTCMFTIDVLEASKNLSSPFYLDTDGDQNLTTDEHQLDLTKSNTGTSVDGNDIGKCYSQPGRSEVAFDKYGDPNNSTILMDDDFNKLWEYPAYFRKGAWNDNYFVFADSQTGFYVLDFSSGSEVCSAYISNDRIADVGILSNDNLFFYEQNDDYSDTTAFTERDPSDGSLINEYKPLGGEEDTSGPHPCLFVDGNDDVYCVKSGKGVVYKLNAGNYGTVVWTVSLSSNPGYIQSLLGSTFNNYVGVLAGDGNLYRIGKDGNEIHKDGFLSGASSADAFIRHPGNVYVAENGDIISAWGTRAIILSEDGSRKETFEDSNDDFVSVGVKEV